MCTVHFVNSILHMTWIEKSSFQSAELLLSVLGVFFSLSFRLCYKQSGENDHSSWSGRFSPGFSVLLNPPYIQIQLFIIHAGCSDYVQVPH